MLVIVCDERQDHTLGATHAREALQYACPWAQRACQNRGSRKRGTL